MCIYIYIYICVLFLSLFVSFFLSSLDVQRTGGDATAQLGQGQRNRGRGLCRRSARLVPWTGRPPRHPPRRGNYYYYY